MAQLAMQMIWTRPDIGVSHGSRSQLLTCFLLRIPNLTMIDYEFVAATAHKADWLMLLRSFPLCLPRLPIAPFEISRDQRRCLSVPLHPDPHLPSAWESVLKISWSW